MQYFMEDAVKQLWDVTEDVQLKQVLWYLTSPTYFCTNSEPMTRMKQASVRLATARAHSVLPVPGGPNSNTPLGGSIPRFTNFSGCKGTKTQLQWIESNTVVMKSITKTPWSKASLMYTIPSHNFFKRFWENYVIQYASHILEHIHLFQLFGLNLLVLCSQLLTYMKQWCLYNLSQFINLLLAATNIVVGHVRFLLYLHHGHRGVDLWWQGNVDLVLVAVNSEVINKHTWYSWNI